MFFQGGCAQAEFQEMQPEPAPANFTLEKIIP
jgi:hypothetical protein